MAKPPLLSRFFKLSSSITRDDFRFATTMAIMDLYVLDHRYTDHMIDIVISDIMDLYVSVFFFLSLSSISVNARTCSRGMHGNSAALGQVQQHEGLHLQSLG